MSWRQSCALGEQNNLKISYVKGMNPWFFTFEKTLMVTGRHSSMFKNMRKIEIATRC